MDKLPHRIVVRLADDSWLYLQRTNDLACPNCGGQLCMDCVLRYHHQECDDTSCPECEGAGVVPGWNVSPYHVTEDQLRSNRVERVHW